MKLAKILTASVFGVAVWSSFAVAGACLRFSDDSLLRVEVVPAGGGFYLFAGTLTEAGGVINVVNGSFTDTSTRFVGTMTHSGADASNYWTEIAYWEWDKSTDKVSFKSIGQEKISSAPYNGEHFGTIVPCP
jgi:hypothetical protein